MKTIIVGGGFIARTHLSAVRSLGHEVTWIAGRNAARTQAFAEENKIPDWTIDIDEALSSDAEIVHICTPPAEHAGIIRKCLAAGKHIICEKPLCMDPDEAAALAEEAEAAYQERGIITALCCNVRYYPANQEIMHLIRSDIETEVSPVLGTQEQTDDFAATLRQAWEQDESALLQTNFFGRSLESLIREGLAAKLTRMPPDAQEKVRAALTRILNEGDGGVLCILL